MTAPDSAPFAALLEENLASASPDLLRTVVKSQLNARQVGGRMDGSGAVSMPPASWARALPQSTAASPR